MPPSSPLGRREILHFFKSNIGQLLDNIQAATAGEEAPPEEEEEAAEPIKFAVEKLVLEGGQIQVGFGEKGIVLPLPRIELNELGTDEGGITANQLALEVMSVVLSQVTETALTAGSAGVEKLKGIFGGDG